MTQEEYHIRFPTFKNNIDDGRNVTFSIGNMKCGNKNAIAIVYFVFHAFDVHHNEIHSVGNKPLFTSKRWVVDYTYSQYKDTFSITDDKLDDFAFIQIELIAIGVNDDNPLYFTQCMLTDEYYDSYHMPDELVEVTSIDMINTPYVELYNNRFDGYLQIIRPSKTSFNTTKLSKADISVLAPHLINEEEVDKSTNIMMEFLNQREQKTNIYEHSLIE